MKNKKKLLLIIGIFLMIISVSFGYYVMRITFNGNGSSVSAISKEINDVTVKIEGTLEFDDSEILPGHTNISIVKLTATGEDKEIYYDILWKGTNTLAEKVEYTIYKTDGRKDVSTSCEQKSFYIDKALRLYEECSIENADLLGKAISSGIIDVNSEETVTVLKAQESILASANGTEAYYYVVIKFSNESYSQTKGGSLNGIVTAEGAANGMGIGESWILANTTVETDTIDLTKTSCKSGCEEATVGLYCWDVGEEEQCTIGDDGNNLTYFYRGDVDNNYVKFAGFYWRIMRINENGSIRMVYSGKVSDIEQGDKETILANNYDDSTSNYKGIGGSKFGKDHLKFNDGGFMYKDNSMHGISASSTIKEKLDNWYSSNIKGSEYEIMLDNNSTYCGDRVGIKYEDGMVDLGSTLVNNLVISHFNLKDGTIYYLGYLRLVYKLIPPTFYCSNINDIYTTHNSILGNKALTYPIGLITADEVTFAGGTQGSAEEKFNTNYYLYTNTKQWTMTPSTYSYSDTLSTHRSLNFAIDANGRIFSTTLSSTGHQVRPVINLKPEVLLTGRGTINEPYEVVL